MALSRRAAGRLLLAAALGAGRTPCAHAAAAPAAGAARYDAYAADYDLLDGGCVARALGLDALRARLVSRARGAVLELGVGTGLNLGLYGAGRRVTGVDESGAMLAAAADRARAAGASLVRADASALSFASAAFDTVLDTFSLCTFADPPAALREARRVLRPARASRLLLLEHAAAPAPALRAYQDALARPVAALAKGCVWNQRVEEIARGAGFATVTRAYALGGTVVALEMRLADEFLPDEELPDPPA